MASALRAAAEVLVVHLGEVELAEPALVEVQASRPEEVARVKVQVQGYERSASEQAADLLAWSTTLRSVAVEAYRPPISETVLVTVSGTIAHEGAEVLVEVYASITERGPFADLTDATSRASSVQEIQRWAMGEPPLGSVVVSCTSCQHTYEPTAEDWSTGQTGCPRCGGCTILAEVGGGRPA